MTPKLEGSVRLHWISEAEYSKKGFNVCMEYEKFHKCLKLQANGWVFRLEPKGEINERIWLHLPSLDIIPEVGYEFICVPLELTSLKGIRSPLQIIVQSIRKEITLN